MPRQILIVDDNLINRQLLKHSLEKDYDILEAGNGKEAMQIIHKNYKVLSAVLLDIVMPIMGGYEVLKAIRENPVLSQLPVIMVTGSEDEASRVKALSYGANDFILKPFNPEIVKHCLNNNIALRETASILNAIQKDKLTGLYNRSTFFDKAEAMIREKEPGYYIISCFDIDNFKIINDQYGAAEGDRILREIGKLVNKDMNEAGGLAGHISADNFAVIFPARLKKSVLTRVKNAKDYLNFAGQSIVFSVGRYVITDLTLPASSLYDRAYIAKRSIKGRYDKHLAYFDDEMLIKLVKDQQISSEMESALEGRQFEVWYQPQYNHINATLIGAEALVRWKHPKKGIISPGDFIPIFEQNGFIYELDKFVWREVCSDLHRWMESGKASFPVSVNISRYDIFRTDLIDVITGLTKEYNIPHEMLHLEVTESAFAKSTELIVDIVKQFIKLGFTVEIDDFGSGYSSLNTLRSVPAQVVKLDMRFLDKGNDSQRGGNILESIIRMTKWIGMEVIAEGVETKEQGDFLKSIGCSHVQGYLYSRPMSMTDFESYFKNAETEIRSQVMTTVENLNNDKFWSPDSMETLIFNSYVGAACVFEYHKGDIELLRATDKYAKLFGENVTVNYLMKPDFIQYIDKKSYKEVVAAIEESTKTNDEIICEFLFVGLPGCEKDIYLNATIRVIASTEDRHLVYCICNNISAQRLSERMERRAAKQLEVIMDGINCGITAFSINGERAEYILANEQYYQLLGYTRQQYRKEIKSLWQIIHPDDRERVIEVSKKTQMTGIPTSMEYRAVCRDGKVIWLRSFLSMAEFEEIEGKVQICTYADVSAEKQMAQELLDNLPCGAGICVVNKDDAQMIYLNNRYFTYFKHYTGAKRAKSVFDVIHKDDIPALKKAMSPALKQGGEGSCVIRILDGEGEYLPFRISGSAMAFGEMQNTIYVTFVPISYEELSVDEMLPVALEKMMAYSKDISFVKNKNLKYICCSREFANITGLDDEKDVAGKSDYDLFDKATADQYTLEDRTLMKNGKSIIDKIEPIPLHKDENRFSRISKYLLYDSFGNAVGIYGMGRDITNIRETEMQQKFLINTIPGGVAVYEGIYSSLNSIRLVYFSEGYCKLFGYTREEYLELGSNNSTEFVDKEYLPGLVKQIEALVSHGTPIDYIYKAKAKNGDLRWIHIKAVLGEKRGENMTASAILFDVTDRQEIVERLRVSEEENGFDNKHSENKKNR